MKVRRNSGATHSFRLSVTAAHIVDCRQPFMSHEGRPYPRSLGGKSKLVSDAITWCYGGEEGMTYSDLQKRVEFWVIKYDELKNAKDEAKPPHWWHRFTSRITRWLQK